MTRVTACIVLVAGATLLVATPPGQVLVPAYQPTYSATDDLLKQILEELKGLRAEVRAGRPAQGADVASVIKTRCAACHVAKAADEKGSGFVLIEDDGALAELSLAEKRRIKRQVEQGRMPPGQPLVEAEKKLLVEHVTPKGVQR